MSQMIKLFYDKARSKLAPKLICKLSHRISIDRLPLRLELLSKIAADRKISISVVLHQIIHDSALSSCLRSSNSDNFHLKKEKNKKAELLFFMFKRDCFQFRFKTFGRQKNNFLLDRSRIKLLLLFDSLTGQTQAESPQFSQTHRIALTQPPWNLLHQILQNIHHISSRERRFLRQSLGNHSRINFSSIDRSRISLFMLLIKWICFLHQTIEHFLE